MKGLEPSTFCMASRRSSQLSYSREGGEYTRGGASSGARTADSWPALQMRRGGDQPVPRAVQVHDLLCPAEHVLGLFLVLGQYRADAEARGLTR